MGWSPPSITGIQNPTKGRWKIHQISYCATTEKETWTESMVKKKNWWSTDSSCPLRIKHLLLIIPRICYEWPKPYPIPLIIKKSTFNKQKHTPYQTSQKGCTKTTHKCNRKSFNGGNSIYPISILTKTLIWAIIWHHRKHYLDIFSETKMTKQLQSPPFSR